MQFSILHFWSRSRRWSPVPRRASIPLRRGFRRGDRSGAHGVLRWTSAKKARCPRNRRRAIGDANGALIDAVTVWKNAGLRDRRGRAQATRRHRGRRTGSRLAQLINRKPGNNWSTDRRRHHGSTICSPDHWRFEYVRRKLNGDERMTHRLSPARCRRPSVRALLYNGCSRSRSGKILKRNPSTSRD